MSVLAQLPEAVALLRKQPWFQFYVDDVCLGKVILDRFLDLRREKPSISLMSIIDADSKKYFMDKIKLFIDDAIFDIEVSAYSRIVKYFLAGLSDEEEKKLEVIPGEGIVLHQLRPRNILPFSYDAFLCVLRDLREKHPNLFLTNWREYEAELISAYIAKHKHIPT